MNQLEQNRVNEFVAWLRTKPAAETYNYLSVDNCALAQFLRWLGGTDIRVGGHEYIATFDFLPAANQQVRASIPEVMINPLHDVNTFGELLERLSPYVMDQGEEDLPPHKVEGSPAEFDRYIAGDR